MLISFLSINGQAQKKGGKMISETTIEQVTDDLAKKYPDAKKNRIINGVKTAASRWLSADGTEKEFADFCLKNFVPEGDLLDKLFKRIEFNLEVINGNNLIISRTLSKPVQLDLGEPLPVDYIFAEYSPSAHLIDDFYADKIAFIMLLNFPPPSFKERIENGEKWSRKEWAFAKLADAFRDRIPAGVNQKVSEAYTRSDNYISEYNIFMGYVVDDSKTAMFPETLKLITHWGLRDELKAQYANTDGLKKQETIYWIMKRIIDGSIPLEVINKKDFLWNPSINEIFDKATKKAVPVKNSENDVRYENFLKIFKSQQLVDPYVPDEPTLIARKFNRDRQIPEEQIEKLLVSLIGSPLLKDVGKLIEKRLGRQLKPFDIWYSGFKSQEFNQDELDKIVRKKYPDIKAFMNDIPAILGKLGFDKETAKFLANHIEVEPARGSGHAMGAETKTDSAYLRTRVPGDGMNYKGFNIAMHELGHCVEQVFTLNKMDYYSLRGVPNTAFTESFAFLFQSRDLFVLGLTKKDEKKQFLDTLDVYWATCEIGGVSLVDMKAWRWMYEHPEAKPAELKDAVIKIAVDVWNAYFAPVFGMKDETILAVYSHMIDAGLYLPDYPTGHIIDFQIEEFIKGKNLAKEMERMCASGSILPDIWMKKATGESISSKPLLIAVEKALNVIK
jgi:hypothetical protein